MRGAGGKRGREEKTEKWKKEKKEKERGGACNRDSERQCQIRGMTNKKADEEGIEEETEPQTSCVSEAC